MGSVGIWEGEERLLCMVYRALTPERANALHILAGKGPRAFVGEENLELLAVAPDAATGGEAPLPSCRLLLLPGTDASLIRRCRAACAMSYGTSPKDSLTVSSLEADHLALSVQRELVTVTGGTVERQELVLPVHHVKEPLFALVWAGLLLILGVPAERLPGLAQETLAGPLRKSGPGGACGVSRSVLQ